MQDTVNTDGVRVPGIGPKDADIMIVGEAPGKQEEKQRKPFVGRSGQLLNDKLSDAGIMRQACYITNVVKERPHNNNFSEFLKFTKNGAQGTQKFWAYVRELEEEIREVDPEVIIAVGGKPLWVLTENRKITKWRGSVVDCSLVPGYKVAPVIHPAAALRKYEWRHLITFDLRTALDAKKNPERYEDTRDYIIDPSLQTCLDYLETCKEKEVVAFDIEVYNQEVGCISFAYRDDEAISIPFVDHGEQKWSPPEEAELWRLIGEILEDPSIKCLAHNAAFDTTFLFRKYGFHFKNIHDTMIGHAVLYPDFAKGLDFVTSMYTTMPYYKDEGKGYFQSGGSNEEFWLYNAKDSIVLMEAWPKIKNQLERLGNLDAYNRARRCLLPILYMTQKGIRMNVTKMDQKSREAEVKILALEARLADLADRPLNPRSSKQLKQYFYEDKGTKVYKSRSTGKPTTNKEAMKRLSRKGHEEARLVLDIRELSKMKGTYYDMDLDPDGRLRCSMNPVGTTSGRWSSRKTIRGTGANMQNQPYEMRKMMMPDEGYVGYEIDLGQAENRVVSVLGPDKRMMEAFESGQDIHSLTAALIFGGEPTKEFQDNTMSDIGNGNDSQRQWGKKANHALNYDMGYKKFAYIYEIGEKEAKRIYKKYHSAYPGVKKFHNKVKNSLRKNRTIENLFGRKRRYFLRWGSQLFTEAYSFIPQSTVADKINEHGVLFIYENQDLMPEVEFLNQIHDSIVFQIPVDVGWKRHEELLGLIIDSLETTIHYEGRPLNIPAETNIMPENFKEGYEFASKPSAEELEEKYNELTG